MKRHTLTCAVLAASTVLAGGANAQSNVVFYGLIDNGVEQLTNAGADGGNATRVSSGGMNNSRFGFRGSEDLGGGLSAVWQLEGGLLTDVGASDGALFKRQANVGLQGRFGRVVMGRSFTTEYDFLVGFDPMAYAPYYSWASSGSGANPNSYSMTTGADNLIKYSADAGQFKFGATYALGEQTTGASDGAKMQAGVVYNPGPAQFVVTYEQANGNRVAATNRHDKAKVLHVGAMTSVGELKVQLVGRTYKSESNNRTLADVRANLYWLGLTYPVAANTTLTGAVYYQDIRNLPAGTDADPAMYVTRLRYALSKRTDVYFTAAYAKAKHDRPVSLSRGEAGFEDSQRGLMAGVQHRF